jgi:hypothetical protein
MLPRGINSKIYVPLNSRLRGQCEEFFDLCTYLTPKELDWPYPVSSPTRDPEIPRGKGFHSIIMLGKSCSALFTLKQRLISNTCHRGGLSQFLT